MTQSNSSRPKHHVHLFQVKVKALQLQIQHGRKPAGAKEMRGVMSVSGAGRDEHSKNNWTTTPLILNTYQRFFDIILIYIQIYVEYDMYYLCVCANMLFQGSYGFITFYTV